MAKKYILISQPKEVLFKMRFLHHSGREVNFEQHINLPIKRRDKTVFRQEIRHLLSVTPYLCSR